MISSTWPVMSCYVLRAGHYDIVHRVEALEASQKEISEEEKGALKRLRGFQINRQREVEKLDALWTFLSKRYVIPLSVTLGNGNCELCLLSLTVAPLII